MQDNSIIIIGGGFAHQRHVRASTGMNIVQGKQEKIRGHDRVNSLEPIES